MWHTSRNWGKERACLPRGAVAGTAAPVAALRAKQPRWRTEQFRESRVRGHREALAGVLAARRGGGFWQ